MHSGHADALRRAFAALSRQEQANLRWHGEHRTRVACGVDSDFYVTAEGFG